MMFKRAYACFDHLKPGMQWVSDEFPGDERTPLGAYAKPHRCFKDCGRPALLAVRVPQEGEA